MGERRGRPTAAKVDGCPPFSGKTRDLLAGKVGFSSGKEYERARIRRRVRCPERRRCHGRRRCMTGAASFMTRLGARLVDNGYAVIPIMPGTKKPGRYHRGAWCDYPGWTRHCVRPTTENEIAVWSQWPDAGIGIAGGTVAAIDIDVADPGVALAIQRLAGERLGETPAVRIGRAPKRLLVYRTEAPFKGFKRPPIEILCEGQQFVAFAVHPDTGRPYEWPEESLADIDISGLPAIGEEAARAFAEAAYPLVPEPLRPARLAGGDGRHRAITAGRARRNAARRRGGARLHPQRRSRLRQLDAHRPRAEGRARRRRRSLFADWSAQSAKNVPEFTAKTWDGFHPTFIGAGTIYHHAIANGWSPDPALVLNGSIQMNGRHPAKALLEKLSLSNAASGKNSGSVPCPACAMSRRPAGPRRRARGHGRLHAGDRPAPTAGARRRRQLVRAGRAHGPPLSDRDQPPLEPLHRRHRRLRIGQEPQPRGHQRAVRRGRPRPASRRQPHRQRRRPAHRAAPRAGAAAADRRVRDVPLGRRRPQAEPAPHHRHPRHHDPAVHLGRDHLPRLRVRQPRRPARAARHQPALPLPLRHDNAAPLLGVAAGRQRRRRLVGPLPRASRPKTTIRRRTRQPASAPRRRPFWTR